MVSNASTSPYRCRNDIFVGTEKANAIKSKLAQTGFQHSQGHSFTATEKLSFDLI